MDELLKLEHLSLVSKICTELDNHLGMNDKDLAEFIIDLAGKHTKFDAFKNALIENGAEFPDSFISNLLRIIQLMKTSKKSTKNDPDDDDDLKSKLNADRLAMKFPGLAMANKPIEKVDEDEKETKEAKESKESAKKLKSVADDMMAELEAFAPSKSGTGEGEGDGDGAAIAKPEKRERSKERKPRRDRSKDREREKDGMRKRSRSRERGGSRDRKRNRSRSKDRRPRSRSKERDRDRDRDRRSRSKDRDRHRRGRSRSRDRRRSTSRSRHRERQKNRNRSRSPENNRDKRNRSPVRKRSATPLPDDPEVGKIYSGRVANIVPFGCFVQLMGLKKRWEGLVHISQLRSEGRVTDVLEVVSRGANVKVKVMSMAGQKVSLSMKEVNQETGADLNPGSHSHLNDEARDRNPDRPMAGTSMLHLEGTRDGNDEDHTRKKVTRISSPERWEIKQMISSGVIDRTELPDFDEETGLLPKDEDNEADIEIEIVEEEPPFLRGHGRALHDLSPVRIVKNPDGSLAQAAMMQSALAKERREVQMLQREQEMDSIPTSLNKNWIDPLPEGMSNRNFDDSFICFTHFMSALDDTRELAANVRGIGIAPQEIPEWKKHVIGGKKSSFGMKTNLTLIEQRQSLPIYKLRDDLIKVSDNAHIVIR